MTCFTRYVHSKSIKMFIPHYPELMRKIKKHEGKKYLIVDDYMLDKALDITFKNVVILMTCVIKDGDTFYP